MVQKHKFDTIANNLANVSTNAFKKNLLSFDSSGSMGNMSGIDFSPGPIVQTGNALDVAITSDGFFKVQTRNGERYTRDGSFSIDDQGFLVTDQGDQVLGENGPVSIKGDQISIGGDGQISVDDVSVDRLAVVSFKDMKNLKKQGFSYYTYNGGQQDIVDTEKKGIMQNCLEKSNVSPTEEMVRMIEAQRGFESCQKIMQVMSEMNQKIVNDIGRG